MNFVVVTYLVVIAVFANGQSMFYPQYRVIPKGVIWLWSGTQKSIPEGWTACDGTNGSPDLRDRFIIGSGIGAANTPLSTGGSSTVQPTITVDGTILSEAQLPSHNHGGVTGIEDTEGIYYDCSANPSIYTTTTTVFTPDHTNRWFHVRGAYYGNCTECQHTHKIQTNGADQPHTHVTTSSVIDLKPSFYALIYIMKL